MHEVDRGLKIGKRKRTIGAKYTKESAKKQI